MGELDTIDGDLSTGDYVPIYLGYRKLTMDRLFFFFFFLYPLYYTTYNTAHAALGYGAIVLYT